MDACALPKKVNLSFPNDCSSRTAPKTWLSQPGFYPCGGGGGGLWCYVVPVNLPSERKEFHNADNSKTHKIMNCNTSYVVYIILCTQCNLIYVGCTKRQLKKRISEHVADIIH